jgi:hypothetical protein
VRRVKRWLGLAEHLEVPGQHPSAMAVSRDAVQALRWDSWVVCLVRCGSSKGGVEVRAVIVGISNIGGINFKVSAVD